MIRHHWTGQGAGLSAGRYSRWTCEQLPGVMVRHCGHPTALRPYYVTGLAQLHGATFARLVDVLQTTERELELAGLWREPIPASARPGRRQPADQRQAALAF